MTNLEIAAAHVKVYHEIIFNTRTFKLWDMIEPPETPSSEEIQHVVKSGLIEYLNLHVDSSDVRVNIMQASITRKRWVVIVSIKGVRCHVYSDMYLAPDTESGIPRRAEAVLVDVARALLMKAEDALVNAAKE
jgi:hypothetical protein